jgi:hypothetical protein
MSERNKFRPTHEIVVPSPLSTLTIPVMLLQGDLWQHSEHKRGTPFPMWKLADGKLEYRHGEVPKGAYIRELRGRRQGRPKAQAAIASTTLPTGEG